MEPASACLGRPLPSLSIKGTTSSGSVHPKRLSRTYMHCWGTYTNEVSAFISGLNLNFDVPAIDMEEVLLTANEHGVEGRFKQLVGVPVTTVANGIEGLNRLRFGDHHTVDNYSTTDIADVVVASISGDSILLRGVGEVKTPCNVKLQKMPISGEEAGRKRLEPLIGQIARYMNESSLRFGFLTTYDSTVFVRRADNFRFDISDPVNRSDFSPSLRESFLFILSLMASPNSAFHSTVPTEILLSSTMRGLDTTPTNANAALSRQSGRGSAGQESGTSSVIGSDGLFWRHVATRDNAALEPETGNPPQSTGAEEPWLLDISAYPLSGISPQTVFLGGSGKASVVIRLGRQVSRRVFEASAEGTGEEMIVKFWEEGYEQRFLSEVRAYSILALDNEHFAQPIFAGEVILSNISAIKYGLLLCKLSGVTLSNELLLAMTLEDRRLLKTQLLDTYHSLRSLGIVHEDATQQNTLWDATSKKIYLIDFEAWSTDDTHIPPEKLEIAEILSTVCEDSIEW